MSVLFVVMTMSWAEDEPNDSSRLIF